MRITTLVNEFHKNPMFAFSCDDTACLLHRRKWGERQDVNKENDPRYNRTENVCIAWMKYLASRGKTPFENETQEDSMHT